MKKLKLNTPTILQMEAVECGAASLAMILAYYSAFIPLEKLRIECGVSRDGSKASNILKAARRFGLNAVGYRKEPEDLKTIKLPAIIHWNFNHFVVLEGFDKNNYYINDPASGKRKISNEDFDKAFTGVVLVFEKNENFIKIGKKQNSMKIIAQKIKLHKEFYSYTLLSGILLLIPALFIPSFTKIFIDNILLSEINEWLFPLISGMIFTALIMFSLDALRLKILLKFKNNLSIVNSSKLFWHLLHLPMEFFTQRYAGEIAMQMDISEENSNIISDRLPILIMDIIQILFFLSLMFFYEIKLAFIILLSTIINISIFKIISDKRLQSSMNSINEKGKLEGVSMSGIQVIESLKAGAFESEFFSKWAGYNSKFMAYQQKVNILDSFLIEIPSFFNNLSLILILIFGSFKVIYGELSLGSLMAFQALLFAFSIPLNRLINSAADIQELKINTNKLNDILNYEKEEKIELKDEKNLKLKGNVEIKNLSFGYNRLESPFIENFNLKIKAGDRVALVGGSGSGKSTISKILSGIYKQWNGEILFDEKNKSEIPSDILYNSLAVVDQDIALFSDSIRNNISLWDNTIDDKDIINACKDACIHDEITLKENSYNHMIEEGGRNFSGGQRQRFEIARALVKNPSIIILDEATSALDSKTEKLIDDNLKKRGCTCIIIAHRLSTIKDCDEIIVMDKGKIVQRGTHEEMKNIEGYYKNLIEVK